MTSSNVILTISKQKWKECDKAMNILLKEIGKNDVKHVVVDSVNTINENLFTQQKANNDSLNITDEEFDSLLDEIKQDTDNFAMVCAICIFLLCLLCFDHITNFS